METQRWNKGERMALAKLGVPFQPRPEHEVEKSRALCGWCFNDLNDCVKGKTGCCGFAIDSGDTAVQ